jgi:methylamine dehydrogenase light chain
VISYNDCCGKGFCGRCFCTRNEGNRPLYYTHKNNDLDWCMGTESIIYNSTVAVVVAIVPPEEESKAG